MRCEPLLRIYSMAHHRFTPTGASAVEREGRSETTILKLPTTLLVLEETTL